MFTFKLGETDKVVSFLLDSDSILNGAINRGAASRSSRFSMLKKGENAFLMYSGFLDASVCYHMMKIDQLRWQYTGEYNGPEGYEASVFEIYLEEDSLKIKKVYTAPDSFITEKIIIEQLDFFMRKLEANSTVFFNDYKVTLSEDPPGAVYLNILNLDTFDYQALLEAVLPKLDDSVKKYLLDNFELKQSPRSFNNSMFKPITTENVSKEREQKEFSEHVFNR